MDQSRTPRVVLIDRPFQLRLAAEFIGLQIVLTALFAGVLYLFMDSEIKAGLASAQASYHSVGQMLLPIVMVLSGFNVLLSSVLVTFFMGHLTHRLARPMLRIRAVLEALSLRRFLDHTAIKPGDQLWKVDKSLTAAVEVVKADVQALTQIAQELRLAAEAGQTAEVLAGIERLEQTLKPWSPLEP